MRRAAIVGALVLAAIFAAALITGVNNEPPKSPEPVQLRDPFRPDHPTREQREKSAPDKSGAGTNKDER